MTLTACPALQDSEWAAEIFEKARIGYSKYGRGCVLIQAQLQSRFKGGARGSKVARQRSEASADPPPGVRLWCGSS